MNAQFDLAFLKEITNDNHQKIQMLVGSFIQNAPLNCEKMHKLLIAKQYQELKAEAHSTTPLYATIGAQKAISIIKRIEDYCLSSVMQELIPVELKQLQELTTELCKKLHSELNLNNDN